MNKSCTTFLGKNFPLVFCLSLFFTFLNNVDFVLVNLFIFKKFPSLPMKLMAFLESSDKKKSEVKKYSIQRKWKTLKNGNVCWIWLLNNIVNTAELKSCLNLAAYSSQEPIRNIWLSLLNAMSVFTQCVSLKEGHFVMPFGQIGSNKVQNTC